MRKHTVLVWDEPQEVTVYQKSKSVWIAVGDYMDKRVETKGVQQQVGGQATFCSGTAG